MDGLVGGVGGADLRDLFDVFTDQTMTRINRWKRGQGVNQRNNLKPSNPSTAFVMYTYLYKDRHGFRIQKEKRELVMV